jgi:hypothetical protein
MWVYIMIFLFVMYSLYKERQFLGCPNVPDGKDCDNANGKAVKDTLATSSDSVDVILNKIKYASEYNERNVVWRRCIIYAFVATIIYAYLIYEGFPSEYHLFCGLFVIAGVFYFCHSFYKFHLSDHIKNNINNNINLLSSKIK